MQFDKFDNKVREAAEQHHPSYDEKAWAKMEKLLDKELPQKKDRRRIIILWLVLLLIGTSAWLLVSRPWQSQVDANTVNNQAQGPATEKVKPGAEQPTAGNVSEPSAAGKITTPSNISDDSPSSPEVSNNKKPGGAGVQDKILSQVSPGKLRGRLIPTGNNDNNIADNIASPGRGKPVQTKGLRKPGDKINQQDQFLVSSDEAGKTKAKRSTESTSEPVKSQPGKSSETKPPVTTQNPEAAVAETKPTEVSKPALNPAIGKDSSKTTAKVETKPKSQGSNNRRRNSLFVSFSAGPDASYVGLDNPGKIKLLGGAGIGYTIGKRITVRTGFYTTHKVYTASKYEYKPQTPVNGYNYLNKINADCNVYEIPLNVAYNFGNSDRHNLFVSAGLSSFLMKKEIYKYEYYYPNNPNPYYYTKTINNQNKHYFSVLTLSGGYQRRINKTLSFTAEPYVKLPLGGVGYGRVKLSSVGVLFSANIQLWH